MGTVKRRHVVNSTDTEPARAQVLPVDAIHIGKRYRKDMGDIAGLADDIANHVGLLLHPVVVRRVGRQWQLVCGARRLQAEKLLGRKTVPVTAHYNMDDATALRAEGSENIHHKPFKLSEAVHYKRDLLELIERVAAKQRQREHGKTAPGRKHSGQVAHSDKGRAADKAAKVTGISRRTLEKAEAIVDAADAEPEKFGKLLEDMDCTGRVNGLFKRLKIARQAESIRAEPPPLPGNGPYRVGVIDVPWSYEIRSEDPSVRGVRPYPTLSLEQIFALPVASLMHEDAILWVWTTNLFMRHAYKALDHWGLQERTILTWDKGRFGNGEWLRGQTEHAIMAVRGRPVVTLTNQTTLLRAPWRGHSVKPPEFYDLVERLCPAPRYADLFSRYQHNEKWDCHGDEVPTEIRPEAAE